MVKMARNRKQVEVARSYSWMEYYFRIGVFLNAVPFHYDYENKVWSFQPKSRKNNLWLVFTFGGMNLEFANVTIELIRSFWDKDVSQGEWCLILFIFLSWWLILVLQWNLFLNSEGIVSLLNQTLQLRKTYTEGALPPSSDHKIVRGHIGVTIPQCVVQCFMVANEGWKRQFLYSHVPEEYRNGGTQAMWSLYCTWRVITNFQVGYFFLFAGMFHAQTMTQLMEYRKLNHELPYEKLKSYRIIQILCSKYNQTQARLALPSCTIFAAANIILGNYGTVRFVDELPLELLMNFPLMAIMMILLVFTFHPKNSTVREASEFEKEIAYKAGVISSSMPSAWADVRSKSGVDGLPQGIRTNEGGARGNGMTAIGVNGGGSVQKRDLNKPNFDAVYRMNSSTVLKQVIVNTRSCNPVAINMGAFYPIKRSTVLTIFQFIICNTISALLTWE